MSGQQVGGAIGSAFGGPIGGLVGGLVGGLFGRKDRKVSHADQGVNVGNLPTSLQNLWINGGGKPEVPAGLQGLMDGSATQELEDQYQNYSGEMDRRYTQFEEGMALALGKHKRQMYDEMASRGVSRSSEIAGGLADLNGQYLQSMGQFGAQLEQQKMGALGNLFNSQLQAKNQQAGMIGNLWQAQMGQQNTENQMMANIFSGSQSQWNAEQGINQQQHASNAAYNQQLGGAVQQMLFRPNPKSK